jgi:hypothetical protein
MKKKKRGLQIQDSECRGKITREEYFSEEMSILARVRTMSSHGKNRKRRNLRAYEQRLASGQKKNRKKEQEQWQNLPSKPQIQEKRGEQI